MRQAQADTEPRRLAKLYRIAIYGDFSQLALYAESSPTSVIIDAIRPVAQVPRPGRGANLGILDGEDAVLVDYRDYH